MQFNGKDMTTTSQNEAVSLLLSAKVGDTVELVVSRQIVATKPQQVIPSSSDRQIGTESIIAERKIGCMQKNIGLERKVSNSNTSPPEGISIKKSIYDDKENKELQNIIGERPNDIAAVKVRFSHCMTS